MELPEYKINKILKIAKEPLSMENPVGDDDDSTIGDFIEDEKLSSPVEVTTSESLKETTGDLLANLSPREAKVLKDAIWNRYEYRSHFRRGRPTI